jgi:hypothetical protein
MHNPLAGEGSIRAFWGNSSGDIRFLLVLVWVVDERAGGLIHEDQRVRGVRYLSRKWVLLEKLSLRVLGLSGMVDSLKIGEM